MSIEFTHVEGTTQLVMPFEFTISNVSSLRGDMLKNLKDADCLEINLSAVEEIDAAGLQLLIAVKQEAEKNHKSLNLYAHSKVVIEIMELFDVTSFFSDPLILPSKETIQ